MISWFPDSQLAEHRWKYSQLAEHRWNYREKPFGYAGYGDSGAAVQDVEKGTQKGHQFHEKKKFCFALIHNMVLRIFFGVLDRCSGFSLDGVSIFPSFFTSSFSGIIDKNAIDPYAALKSISSEQNERIPWCHAITCEGKWVSFRHNVFFIGRQTLLTFVFFHTIFRIALG